MTTRHIVALCLSPVVFLVGAYLVNVINFLRGNQACSYYYSSGGENLTSGCFDPNNLPKNVTFFAIFGLLLLLRFVLFPLVRRFLKPTSGVSTP